MSALRLLCAGAAQGVVEALRGHATGERLDARFGPVGMLKEALLGGAPCDVFVASAAIVDSLVADGRLDATTRAEVGRVATGVAVRDGDKVPRVDDEDALRAALAAADRVFLPDPQRATAGIHFAKVIERLGLRDRLSARLSIHPSGAAAMQALAASRDARPIGCTQVSEILHAAGVRLAGRLPRGHELTTTYVAAVASGAAEPPAARRFVERLVGPESAAVRLRCGFEAA